MIKLEQCSVTIENKKILKDISCTINSHDFVVVVGHNGAGKSTFFDLITGARKPSSGKIFLHEKEITQSHEHQRASYIARLFQNPQANGVSSMTVEQNLALSLCKGRSARLDNAMSLFNTQEIHTKLQEFGMNDPLLLKTPMQNLSGGQRQLLAFVMATLAYPPELLLLDEPTAALDPMAATKLLQFALEYIRKNGITTLLITHDPHLALAIGNKIWILDNGTIIKQYSQEEKKLLSAQDLIGHIQYDQLI